MGLRAAAVRVPLALVAGLVLVAPTGAAHPASSDTSVAIVITAASGRLSPGLCAPGDTPWCVGAYQTQWHFWITECIANGRFEGRSLPPNTPCGVELGGFMVGSVGGLSKPSCLTAHTYTSDEAKAFGPPVNRVDIEGVTTGRPGGRKLSVSYPAGALISRTALGWVDDMDADDDPVGDHSAAFSIQARTPSPPAPGEVRCVTHPFTDVAFTAVMLIS